MAVEHPHATAEQARWETNRVSHIVLLVARTLTSATQVLDVLDLIRGDFRIKTILAVDEGSHSGAGVEELLRRKGIHRIIRWADLPGEHYDLAISASEQIDLNIITSVVIVLPHGVGFNKNVPNTDLPGSRLAGLPPIAALLTGRVRLVLSHSDERAQLLAVRPEVAGQTVVAGNVMFDRLRASLPLRTEYRHALGADHRTLILLSSTWGGESAFGHWRELPRRLLAELPADEYRVCVALHPNAWSRHGPAVIRTWLADCLDAGLHLLPPEQGWQAALLASDLVLGDHGSVTLLAAALGKPLLLAAFGSETEVVPGTPVAALGRTVDRLEPAIPLRDQLDKAIAEHDPRRFAGLTSRTFAHVGEADTRLRKLIYDELGLRPPPTEPILRRFPGPPTGHLPATAFDVYAELSPPRSLTLHRYPRPAHESAGAGRHLAVDDRCEDLRLLQTAAVIARSTTGTTDWAAQALSDWPGARLAAAATENGCIAAIRGEGRYEITARTGTVDTLALASALYSCLLGGNIADGPLVVRAGPDEAQCLLRKL